MSIDITTLSTVRWQLFKEIRLESLGDDPVFERHYREETVLEAGFWRETIRYGVFALSGDKPDGLVLYEMLNEPDVESCAKIYGLYVNLVFRRRGVAGRLFERILALIAERETVHRIILSVNAGLTHAVRLYQRHGFRVLAIPEMEGTPASSPAELTMGKYL